MIILISYLIIPIKWVSYPQKVCDYRPMTLFLVFSHFISDLKEEAKTQKRKEEKKKRSFFA